MFTCVPDKGQYYYWEDNPPEVNAGFIEDGSGGGSWNSAAGSWRNLAKDLGTARDNINALIGNIDSSLKTSSGKDAQECLRRAAEWFSEQQDIANNTAKRMETVSSSYSTAKTNMIPVSEITANRARLAKMTLASNLPFGVGAIADVITKNSRAEAEKQYQEYRLHNAQVMTVYSEGLKSSVEDSENKTGEKIKIVSDNLSPDRVTGVNVSGGPSMNNGYVGPASGGGGGAYASGWSGGGVSFAPRTGSFGGFAGGGSQFRSPFNSPDFGSSEFNLDDYLPPSTYSDVSFDHYEGPQYDSSRLTTGTSSLSSPYTGTSTSYSPQSYTGNYTSPSYTSSNFSTGLSSATPVMSAASGTYSGPRIGLPGGMSGIGRFASAGTMNPMAFGGSGLGGSPAASTGGLGMLAARGVATPASGFGGVQTTPASATAARPPMGMVPAAGAGGRGRGNSQSQNSEAADIRDASTNIYAGISAFGTRRVAEDLEVEEKETTARPAY